MQVGTATYLITGASRGLGRALVAAFLRRPNSTVIATVRDTQQPNAESLSSLPKDPSSTLIIVELDTTSEADHKSMIHEVQTKYMITHLDVVVANAGICKVLPKVIDVKADQILEHVRVNVFGPILLFQATLSLLERSSNPRFMLMGSNAGSLSGMEKVPVPSAAYGASKAMAHYHCLKMHFEHPNITVFNMHPGWVRTDLGNVGAHFLGVDQADVDVEESIEGVIPILDAAKRETHSGRFWSYDGQEWPW